MSEPAIEAQQEKLLEHQGIGIPDAFERLWAPHRMVYLTGDKPEGCPFCRIIDLSDEEGLIVARGKFVFAVLNLYPYNPGHLMVVPYRHMADYPDLTPKETCELAEFTQRAMQVICTVTTADGFNIGMNQGVTGGAGIAAHLHQHVVPRWRGDTNFVSIIGNTKVFPQLLADTRALFANAWRI